MQGGVLPPRSDGPGSPRARRCSTIPIFPRHTPHLAGSNYGGTNFDEAVQSYRRAQELNPSFADGHHGHVLAIAGLAEEGLKALLRARLLDPFHPPMLLGWLGHCHLMLDQPEQALVFLRECTIRAPGWRPGHVWRGAACAQLGLHDEARSATACVVDIDPRFTVAAWQRMHGYRDERRASIVARGLVRAGLPGG
jgi:adenylate cyclase